MNNVVEKIKKAYPMGTRIKLNYMNDPRPIESGTLGTVDYIDDMGQIHVKWDNGRYLAVVWGVDKFERVSA